MIGVRVIKNIPLGSRGVGESGSRVRESSRGVESGSRGVARIARVQKSYRVLPHFGTLLICLRFRHIKSGWRVGESGSQGVGKSGSRGVRESGSM